MQWKKKTGIAVAAIAVTSGLILSGCSTGGDAGSTDQPKFLKIEWLANEKAGIDAIVAAYLEANPDTQVIVSTADTAQYQAALRTELSTGTAPDVAYVWPANGNTAAIEQLNAGEYLADLSDQPWVSEYPAYIKDLTSVDGKVLVMAPLATSFLPVYNQDVLDQLGLTPPTTWSEVIPFCKAAADAGKVAWAMPGNHPYGGQTVFYNLVADLVYGTGTEFDQQLLNGDTAFPENKGYVAAADKLQQMIDSGCFQPNSTGTPYEETNRMVAAGEALGVFFIGTRLAALQALAPDTNFRTYQFHGDDDDNTNAVTLSTQGGAAVYAKSERKELAIDFVNFLAENIDIYQGAQPGTVPTLTSGFTTEDPNEQLLIDLIDANQAVHFLNQRWPNARIEATMNAGLTAMLAGTGSAKELLEGMQVEFDTE